MSLNPLASNASVRSSAGRWQQSVESVLFGRKPSLTADSPELQRARERWANPVNRPSLRQLLWAAAIIALFAWAWRGVEGDLVELATDFTDSFRIFEEFMRPDWSILERAIEQTIVTVQMSIIGIAVAALISIPLGLAAARNVANAGVYSVMRVFLSLVRTVPDLVWAIIFVVVVGLGPFAGTLAIIVGSSGSFGKLFAESIESVDPRPVDAVRATGAPSLSASTFSVLPQAFPMLLSYVLFYWESTVRNAAIFGLVGAGGIGQLIDLHLGLLRYDRLAVDILCIFVAVVIIDRVSALLRSRLL